MTASTELLVLGAGPAGLAAAWQAATRGHQVTVVERAPVPGGMASSFDVAGVRVDHGSHRLHPSIAPAILDALRGLLGDDLQIRERNGRIRLLGEWIAFPLRTGDLLRRLPPSFAARAARDALAGPLRRPRADTFAEVVRARLGPTVADEFYGPYIRKLWDAEPSELAGALARRRVSASSFSDVARRLVRSRNPEGRTFLYPRQGFGQITEALAGALAGSGGELLVGRGVTGVKVRDDGVSVALDDGSTIDAARLWSTIPLAALASMASPGPDRGALEAAARLRHRALALVYLVLDRPRYTAFDAHYFPEEAVPMARLSEPKNYRESADDPPDRTVLCAEVPCWEGDERWTATPETLGRLVAEGIEVAGLPPVDPVAVQVRRLPRVYPVYRPGFEADLAAVQRWEDEQARLTSFGRQGLFVPDNTHHALAMGWAAAEALGPDGTWDDAAWREARDGFGDHVVED